MSNLPRISVITPTFNSVHTIRDTIESVLNQGYKNWEHLVIDGGSTDGTLEILKEYSHLIWVSEKDEGHYHAMNKGVMRAGGEIVNILNGDDCYRPGALQMVAQAFADHPDWDGLFGDIVYVDGEGRKIFSRAEAKYDYDVLRHGGVCYVIHQTLFLKKSVHDRVGYYRHKVFVNACDFDLILELGRQKCQIGHVPEYLINYRYHEYGQSADLRVTRNMTREAALIAKDHGAASGILRKFLRVYYRLLRQGQKLLYRGKCDLIPGNWTLRKHMKQKTSFTSNMAMEKL